MGQLAIKDTLGGLSQISFIMSYPTTLEVPGHIPGTHQKRRGDQQPPKKLRVNRE
jgi:hypothetical protein